MYFVINQIYETHLACLVIFPSADFFKTNGRRLETTIKLFLTFGSADVTVI